MYLKTKTITAFSATLLAFFALAGHTPAQAATIIASPTQLTFNVTPGSSTATQNLVVISSTSTAASFTVSAYSTSNWLSVTPISGTTPQVLTVSVTPGSLTAGSYGGFVSIVAGGVSSTVPVILNVNSSGVSTFTASPSSVTFNFATGATVPQTDLISITASSTETFAATPSSNNGGSWLTVNPNAGTTPGSFSITVNPAGLSAGPYAGSVAVNAPGATGLVIPVTVNVAAQGALNINPQQLSFAYQLGTTAPAEQTISLTTTGTSLISFTASATSQQCGGNWLVVSPQSGAAPATLSVQINTTGLTAGTCDGTINISAPSAANSMISIPVTLLVSTNALLQVPTTGVTFAYQLGTVAPGSQTVQVTSSSTALPFTVSAAPISGGPSFLTVSPASGTSPQAITLTVNPTALAGLAPNTYAETVTVTSPTSGNASISFPVTLVVSNNPSLLLTQSAVTFNYQIGQAGPPNQTITLSSAGAPLTYAVTTSTSNCNGFLSASPTSGTTSITSQVSQIILSVNTSGLTTPETCNGTVTLSVPGSTNAPETIPVTLNVSSTPLLNASPAVINVSAIAGSITSVQQTISLTSTDNTTALSFTATAATTPAGLTWLSVAPNTGSTPASLNVTVNSTNLPAGTYMGSINVSSTTANVLPQTIPVVLTVFSGTVAASTTSLTFSQGAGGSNPASQTIQVSNVPTGATVGATATVYSGTNFLTVTTSGNTVTVSASGSQLSQGTYQGVVTIFVPGASNSPLYVPVTLTVGPPAAFTTSPTALTFTYQTGTALTEAQTIQISSASTSVLPFSVVAVAPPGSTNGVVFISVTPTSGTTPDSITVSLNQSVVSSLAAGSYTDLINLTSTSASGTQTIPVTLTVTSPGPPTVTSVVSGASYQSGAVSPGEIISIFGTNIGPSAPAGLTLTANNMVETTLSNTTVTFNGVPAPLIYVSLNQINAIVPYQVSGLQSVPVVVTTGATVSSSFTVNVAATAPALFALSQNGSGPGAILDQNGSLNESSNSAAPGSIIVIYATGEGVTTPASATGSVTSATGTSFPKPSANVTVTIGGIDAQILYAGEAPGLVAGVLQVNAVVPAGTAAGNQPVVLTVGGVSSPSSVTAAIQ